MATLAERRFLVVQDSNASDSDEDFGEHALQRPEGGAAAELRRCGLAGPAVAAALLLGLAAVPRRSGAQPGSRGPGGAAIISADIATTETEGGLKVIEAPSPSVASALSCLPCAGKESWSPCVWLDGKCYMVAESACKGAGALWCGGEPGEVQPGIIAVRSERATQQTTPEPTAPAAAEWQPRPTPAPTPWPTAQREAEPQMLDELQSGEPQREAASHDAAWGCAWSGEDCSASRCCNQGGMQCFRKNEYHSGCLASCEPTDETGEPWACDVLGGFRDVPELAPASAGEPTLGSSIFCFAGVLPGSSEEGLIAAQKDSGRGIFSCDGAALYSTDYTAKGEWQSVVNTDVFIQIWERVRADGQYANHDWAVKVDPDTVFHPQRLRDHLVNLRAPAGASLYVKNSRFKFGFQGSLEVLSKQALEDLAAGIHACSSSLGREGGEDFYLVQCLDGLGVAHMLDDSMLDDKYTYDHEYDMGDLSFCGSGIAAAYHPVKDPAAWAQCHDMGR